MIESGEPLEVEELKTSLNELNSRYQDVDSTTKKYADDINSLTTKLGEFEKRAEELDSWLVPTIQTVHSKAFGQMPENQLEGKIKVSIRLFINDVNCPESTNELIALIDYGKSFKAVVPGDNIMGWGGGGDIFG